MPDHSSKYWFECINCGEQYAPGEVEYLCPDCAKNKVTGLPPKGILKTKYHYDKIIRSGLVSNQLHNGNYLDLLPIQSMKSWPNLSIGNTPLYQVKPPWKNPGMELWLKDDSQNPSFSFKDRASALVSAYAKEHQIDTIITASTGNAGSSISAICAMQGQRCIVLVPANAPRAKLYQISLYGATLVPVDGKYDDAFELSIQASKHFGWYNRNTAYNPLTIEGKKTVAFELFSQLDGQLPDRIFVPVGDGVIISGLYKGFEELLLLGLIQKVPVMVAVQSEKSDNLVSNLDRKIFQINPKGSVADSITVDVPGNFYMTKNFMDQYNGLGITVSDESILEASALLASKYGLFAEPAASASMAGFLNLQRKGELEDESKNLLLLTGSGLKDLNSVSEMVNIPDPVRADIDALKKLLR